MATGCFERIGIVDAPLGFERIGIVDAPLGCTLPGLTRAVSNLATGRQRSAMTAIVVVLKL